MRVFVVANQKGGVCKTTLAVHLATHLARKGKRVALVDLDAQGNAAQFLGLDPVDDVAELIRSVLALRPDRRPPITSFLTAVPGYPNLVMIRGWGKSADLEADLRGPGVDPVAVLREALAPLLARPVYVILDTGPHAGALQGAALALAGHVIVPGIPEPATESGVLEVARRLRAAGRSVTAVIPTKIITTAKEHKATIADWVDALGAVVYYDPAGRLFGLPRRVVWGSLPGAGRPIWDVAPKNIAALEMAAICERVVYDARIA